ncbi:hypothetical protein, partial [uncultured Sulfitobacter sp.]|uniref:hypothetical protein n=1 Tax=uncultured Sulfitobacter sp. TaxID=191468 RepID=UPI002594B180
IIDDALWDRVKVRQKEARIEMGKDSTGNALNPPTPRVGPDPHLPADRPVAAAHAHADVIPMIRRRRHLIE